MSLLSPLIMSRSSGYHNCSSPSLAEAEVCIRTASPPADDPLYASSPHEQIDFSGDSEDKIFNEDSEAELEVGPSISRLDRPPRDTGMG